MITVPKEKEETEIEREKEREREGEIKSILFRDNYNS